DFDRLSWHHHNLRQWSFEVQWHLHPFSHPRHDDPYVMVRDAAARNEGDNAATPSDPQPSQPPGSPRYHL
ncbi:hypothetical protein Tco_0579855, partial [Tanacetum coccineum]